MDAAHWNDPERPTPDANWVHAHLLSARELGSAIDDVLRRCDQRFDSLTDTQLATVVYATAPCWRVHDVLAHLAGSALRYALLLVAAESGQPLPTLEVDAFNAIRIADRRGRSVARLLDEVRETHHELTAYLRVMPPGLLEEPIVVGATRMPLSALLFDAAVRHPLGHLADVGTVLAAAHGGAVPPRLSDRSRWRDDQSS